MVNNNIQCAYCGKELNRKVFCSPSHKVMYHRLKSNAQTKSEAIEEAKKEAQKINLCKHGSMVGLCKHGC